MTDNVAIWVSCGSVLVSFASVVIALKAKQQARQAALLMSRAEAIANLRHALGDLNRDGLASTNTMDRIQNALNLSHLVFSKAVRKNVEQAYISARLVQQGEDNGKRHRYAERGPFEANSADESRSGSCPRSSGTSSLSPSNDGRGGDGSVR